MTSGTYFPLDHIFVNIRGVHKLNRAERADQTEPKNRVFFGFYTHNGPVWSGLAFNGQILFGPGPRNKNCKKRGPDWYIYIYI